MRGYQTNMFPIDISFGTVKLVFWLLLVTWFIVSVKNVTEAQSADDLKFGPLWFIGLFGAGIVSFSMSVGFIYEHLKEIINFITQYIRIV